MPEVSIVIPTYNRANFLEKAVQSVLNQTFKDFELIIVDDGSVDNTKEVIKQYVEKDPRVKYFYQKNSGGTSVPRNVGIENSKGSYLAFLDSDDQWLPEKLEKQVLFFKNTKDKQLGFLDCGALVINASDESIIAKYKLPYSYRGNIFEKILKNNFILTPSGIFIKRIVLETIGKFDEDFKMLTDWDLYLRISKNYNFDFINESLFKYYVHKENITKTLDRKEIIKDVINLFEKHKNDYSQYFPNLYIENLRYFANLYCKSGQGRLGRELFIKTIKLNWRDYKSYFYFLLSLSGSKFYNFCFIIKRCFLGKKRKIQLGNIENSYQDIFGLIFESKNIRWKKS